MRLVEAWMLPAASVSWYFCGIGEDDMSPGTQTEDAETIPFFLNKQIRGLGLLPPAHRHDALLQVHTWQYEFPGVHLRHEIHGKMIPRPVVCVDCGSFLGAGLVLPWGSSLLPPKYSPVLGEWWCDHYPRLPPSLFFFLRFLFIYSSEREKEAETGRGRSRLPARSRIQGSHPQRKAELNHWATQASLDFPFWCGTLEFRTGVRSHFLFISTSWPHETYLLPGHWIFSTFS